MLVSSRPDYRNLSGSVGLDSAPSPAQVRETRESRNKQKSNMEIKNHGTLCGWLCFFVFENKSTETESQTLMRALARAMV